MQTIQAVEPLITSRFAKTTAAPKNNQRTNFTIIKPGKPILSCATIPKPATRMSNSPIPCPITAHLLYFVNSDKNYFLHLLMRSSRYAVISINPVVYLESAKHVRSLRASVSISAAVSKASSIAPA